jgi:hypothetical protein
VHLGASCRFSDYIKPASAPDIAGWMLIGPNAVNLLGLVNKIKAQFLSRLLATPPDHVSVFLLPFPFFRKRIADWKTRLAGSGAAGNVVRRAVARLQLSACGGPVQSGLDLQGRRRKRERQQRLGAAAAARFWSHEARRRSQGRVQAQARGRSSTSPTRKASRGRRRPVHPVLRDLPAGSVQPVPPHRPDPPIP